MDFESISSREIAESYGGSYFEFFDEAYTVFHNYCTNLNFHQLCTREKTKSFSTKICYETGMPTLTTSVQHNMEVLAMAIKQEKAIKGIHRKEEVTFPQFVENMILCVKHPRVSQSETSVGTNK